MIHTIALLTDFGQKDWFIGSMKGVMSRINPKIRFIDITHQISPQNVQEAAFVLWNAYSFFPSGTLFLSVVDPGVGTNRDIIILKTPEYLFVAPDNGLLDFVLTDLEILQANKVTNTQYFLPNVSKTFHGRDIFSPVAAYLSTGLRLESFGEQIPIPTPKKHFIDVQTTGEYQGEIIYIDTFGNLISNLKVPPHLNGTIKCGQYHFHKWQNSYASAKINEPLCLINGSGLLEIAIRNGNAQQQLTLSYGQSIHFSCTSADKT